MATKPKASNGSADRQDLIDQLHDCITNLTTEAGDPDYSHDERTRLIRQAKAIRDRRMILRKMEFDADTSGYQESIRAIDDVNAEISRAVDRINDMVAFFQLTATLVGALNRLIAMAVPL